MPTISYYNGYRFFFYSLEGKGKPHVHVYKAGVEAKIWLEPLELAKNTNFSNQQLRDILRYTGENKTLFLDAWYEYFGY
jgi:hypothetical protein